MTFPFATRVPGWLVLAAVAGPAPAQVGEPLPKAELTEFTNTPARSLDELKGRAVLIEFFAYW